MAGKWHLGQQNGSPPWQRGFDRVLNIRAGGIFFPNQNFQGGDELTKRGQEPLYLDGQPIAHDSPQLGQNWYDISVDGFRPEVRRRGEEGQQAFLSVLSPTTPRTSR